ncbi:MAG: GAF domain-containing protein [Candidatus Obscuribacterales bacterium]|nr:GAF domain-containing protein [Candidatus Obscuribacterales bacterium]
MGSNGISSQHQDVIEQVLDLNGSPETILQATVDLLHDNMTNWNWVGIYFLSGDHLVLGPYKGAETEHTKIQVGQGVCGSAVKENTNIIVDDVRERANYIACTPETRSEIVVLIRYQDQIVGQFDVDSDNVGNFSKEDEEFLVELADLVGPYCRVLAGKAV